MTTTLTREKLRDKAKLRYEEVTLPDGDVIGVRQRSELKRMQRTNQLFDGKGNLAEDHSNRRRVYLLVDQLMVDESTPMFPDAEAAVAELLEGGSEQYDPIIKAIQEFNERIDPQKKEPGESSDTSEN